jgi:aminoglycoside phosphotransferase family enzyme/predicted kinase
MTPGAVARDLSGPDAMIAALRDPGRYPHPVERVELLETHISWVLLTGSYAYKLKKPVSLGFLDFGTLEARRVACEEELRLNRRTAPDLYLEVVPVTGTAADPRLGGDGEPIDYAVKMREFPQDALLDRVAARGELRLELMDELAAEVAAFHAHVARAEPGSEFGSPADAIGQARQNFDQLRSLGPGRESTAALQRLAEWTEREFARRAPAFAARRDAGFVRECHGDLHLRNLLLLDGRIVPFDCIEFNAHFRWIDVMSEVAFLVMDLVDHGFAAHAARFLDAYLEGTGDYAGLGCLRFYLVYRAMVRAKVAWMRGHQLAAGTPERGRAEAEFRDYLRLAERFVALERRALVLTRGLSGSGKTVFSGLLVEEIGAIRVRSDVERKRLHGLAAAEQTGAAAGGGIYGPDATRRTYARLAEIARIVLDAGFPAVVDATFLLHVDRDALRALAREAGATFAIAACEAPEPVLRDRILARARAGSDASEANLDVLVRQIATAQPLAGGELTFAVRVDTARDLASLRAAAAAIGARLGLGSWQRRDP